MPLSYRVAFGSRLGVDGYFFRHFQLNRAQVIAAVRVAANDDELVRWFLARASVNQNSITAWNELAPNLGAKGHPGYATRQCIKWILYPKSATLPVRSIFEAIVQDEGLNP